GQIVTGQVEIKVVESSSMADMITARLQTTADEGILESAGMIFIDASADGKPVALNRGSALTVSFSSSRAGSDFKYFQGYPDAETGNTVWKATEEDDKKEDNYLIPLPLELLYPDDSPLTYSESVGDGGYYWFWNFDSTKYNLRNEKYTNTLIATKE